MERVAFSIFNRKRDALLVKKGDIIFVQGKGVVSRIIRVFDKGKFSHVAIAMSESQVIEADVDTKVAVRPLSMDKYRMVEIVDLELTLKQREEVVKSALKMVGTKYDYIQLLWYALRKIFGFRGRNRLNNPKYVICSEMVFRALNEAGILEDLGIDESYEDGIDLTPNELYDLVKYISKK
ncbi:hypothetical protein MOE90_20555 [Bacillus spizizenii]|nr:hypothetical protein [Bacillus spizizenii]